MWEAAWSSMKLFMQGKLFLNVGHVIMLAIVGIVVTAVAFVVLLEVGLPLFGAVAIAAFGGGVLQPRLFKNLKYR